MNCSVSLLLGSTYFYFPILIEPTQKELIKEARKLDVAVSLLKLRLKKTSFYPTN